MATTSTRTTKKASSAARSSARTTTGAARKTASNAKKTTKSAAKTAKSATKTARKSATAAKSRASATARSVVRSATRPAKAAKRAASATKPTAAKRSTAKRSTAKRSTSTRSTNRGPDALRLLIEDHETVEALFKKFEGLGDRAHKAKGDVVAKVIEELSVHAVVEEQAFYPAIRTQAKSIEEDVLEALEEHHVVKWTLSELEKMSPDEERYDAKFTVLMEAVRHHVEEEESDMFPKVRKALTKGQLQEIGAALAEAKKSAPRRPHPRSPDTPPGNLIAGALSAPLDAARSAGQDAVDSVRKFASRATGGNGR